MRWGVADGDPFPTSRHCAALTFGAPGPTQQIITATHDGFVLSPTVSISDMSAESQNDSKASQSTRRNAMHCSVTRPEFGIYTCPLYLDLFEAANLSCPGRKSSNWAQTGNHFAPVFRSVRRVPDNCSSFNCPPRIPTTRNYCNTSHSRRMPSSKSRWWYSVLIVNESLLRV